MNAFLDAGVLVALYLGATDMHYTGVAAALAAGRQNKWTMITSRLAQN